MLNKVTHQSKISILQGKSLVAYYKQMLFILGISLVLCLLNACQQTVNTAYEAEVNQADYLHRSMKKLTDVIVHDIFSPPVASRIYTYPSIAAYEVLQQDSSDFVSIASQLNGLGEVPQPNANKTYCFPLASVHAFLTVGKALIFSEDKIAAFQEQIYTEMKAKGIPQKVYANSMDYGDAVAKHVLAWADKDNYKQTRTFPKFSINDELERWQPTPPDYMEGIEPHWSKIRPFVIDSATQFVPAPPTAFSLDKKSPFYTEVMEVYETVNKLDSNQTEIAKFWDCNPYVSHHRGHVMYATKKITPGGHWVGITAISCKKAKADLMQSAASYATVTLALADGFISCWDEKYRSNLVRPETYINQHIDTEWQPLLQTPPFPEYTSGHSVISTAAATILTKLYGEPFQFVDTTEVEYGLPPRTFNSFYEASAEAAVSRLYGGIHYMPAIEDGVAQGKKVGNFIAQKVVTNTVIGH
ncbi:MAG: vanadium-dependent haloperoxidase [Chitinophagales bacterium]